MFSMVLGYTACGLEGMEIQVEVDVSNGLPAFEIVGLPAAPVREAKERVKAAIRNSHLPLAVNRITVNLAPADVRKDGSGLDLPIALGILIGNQSITQAMVQGKAFIGELSLDGAIRKVPGVLSMIRAAKKNGVDTIFIPPENAAEGKLIDGIEVYTPATLHQLLAHLLGYEQLEPLEKRPLIEPQNLHYRDDFADVKGQGLARRAMEIAAAGGHSVLMVGPPGCGKTMLAKRLVSILPPMTEAEALMVTEIYSIAGLLPNLDSIVAQRPFRSPHHSISSSALLGGGTTPKPGEVTLSHHGVLFLDELSEFNRYTLEMLRQPLEDGEVNIARVKAAMRFPSKFLLVAAQNPCPCGYLGDLSRPCTCNPRQVEAYRNKLSGPLLDRIDLQINLARVPFEDLKNSKPGESSATIRQRVVAARNIQLQRYEGKDIYCNAQMGRQEVNECCQLDQAGQQLMERYFHQYRLTARSHDRVLKVARTIADLEGKETIAMQHIAEAIQLRTNIGNS